MRNLMLARVSLAVVGGIVSSVANSGSFSLYGESNGYSVGNYAAGVAAEAYDASTGWYNPAGLALIHKQQAILGAIGVLPSLTLSGSTQFNTSGHTPYNQTFNNIQGAENAVVPSFYYAKPLGDNATFGFSVNAPFGLSTNWGEDSAVRYAATLSKLLSVDISPELGGKITENVALGLGLDLQFAQVKFNSVLGSPATFAEMGDPPTFWDSSSYNEGESWAGGVHAGIMLMFNENHTRLGLNYQSSVSHQFHGFSRLTGPLADPDAPATFNPDSVYLSNDLVSNDIQFPDIVTLSGYHDVNEKLALLGSVVFTNWSVFKEIELENVAGFDPDTGVMHSALVDFVSNEDYRNAWRAAVGVNYHINDRWMLRVGGGFDETPTINLQRTARLPDGNRWALSVGAHYQPFPQLIIDGGYTYLQSNGDVSVNKTISLGDINTFTVNAHGHAYVNLAGGQITWLIDKVN